MSRIWQASAPVTLYHDGKCPLCQREVAWLARHPGRERVRTVDIRASDFSSQALGLSFETMMGRLHVQDARGEWYVGMDASRALYAVLGYRRLVHLSSPSIYFDGKSHRDVTEDFVPPRFFDHYGATKHLADQRVFAAGQAGLEVIALRPRFVIGAGDTSIFPRLLRAHQSGRLRIIGDGTNRVDLTPVENVNLAMHAALNASPSALGRAYNISNGEPVAFWDQFNRLLVRLGMPPLRRHIPFPLAYGMAALAEVRARLTPGQPEPAILRLGMAVMARNFNLDISGARQHLDYQPKVATEQGIEHFATWWQAGMPSLADYLPAVDAHR